MTTAAADHAAAVVAVLAGTGRPVGDASAPAGLPPYCIVYDIAGGDLDGPLGDPYADVDWPFQVTCVGRLADEARRMADKVRVALDAPVTVAGRAVRVVPDGGLGPVARDDETAGPPLWYCTPRFRLYTTPT